MKWKMNRKKIKIMTCLLAFVVLVSLLSLQPQSKELLCPYPTMQVANYPDGEWGTYNILTYERDSFGYRLNFSFPQHDLKGSSLRSFRVIVILPPGLVSRLGGDRMIIRIGQDEIDATDIIRDVLPENLMRVRTVRNEVDVTEYFEITSILNEYGRWILEIIANDIALRNPRFYEDWAHLYVEFHMVRFVEPAIHKDHWIFMLDLDPDPNQEWQILDLNIPNNFRVVGEFYDGEVFDEISNMVYTYYYLKVFPCGCPIYCRCPVIQYDPRTPACVWE